MGRPDLTVVEKTNIVFDCLEKYHHNSQTFDKNAVKNIAIQWRCSKRTVYTLFSKYLESRTPGASGNVDYTSKKKGRVGRKSLCTPVVQEQIIKINQDNLGELTADEMVVALEDVNIHMPRTSVRRNISKLNGKYSTSHCKPALSQRLNMARLLYILHKIYRSADGTLCFMEEKNTLHLDESWIELQRRQKRRLTFPGQPRFNDDMVDHQNHLTRYMTTAIIGQPNENFDGKLMLEGSTKHVAAKKNSKNRPKGTIEEKQLTITADSFLESQVREGGVLDQIALQRPGESIQVQLDNASPHTGHNNIFNLNQEALDRGLEVLYVLQPARSPDLNLCDLSFFHSNKKRTAKMKFKCHTIADLHNAVDQAFDQYDSSSLLIQYGHLWACFNEILKIHGGNQYKNPHAQVRIKYDAGEPLNIVALSAEEILVLVHEVEEYYEEHDDEDYEDSGDEDDFTAEDSEKYEDEDDFGLEELEIE